MRVLADTSVWIDHYRRGDAKLVQFLDRGEVVMHPFVIGELVLGSVSKIADMLDDLRDLPKAAVASNDEILSFIIGRKLSGSGIGYVDAHLLAAAALAPETSLWTRDKRLREVARSLTLALPE
jgi:predicted nucleic acid-binding protein